MSIKLDFTPESRVVKRRKKTSEFSTNPEVYYNNSQRRMTHNNPKAETGSWRMERVAF